MKNDALHAIECDCQECLDKWEKVEKPNHQEKPIKDYSLREMIEMAKQTEYGCVWYSEKGPIQITKEGKLEPI